MRISESPEYINPINKHDMKPYHIYDTWDVQMKVQYFSYNKPTISVDMDNLHYIDIYLIEDEIDRLIRLWYFDDDRMCHELMEFFKNDKTHTSMNEFVKDYQSCENLARLFKWRYSYVNQVSVVVYKCSTPSFDDFNFKI